MKKSSVTRSSLKVLQILRGVVNAYIFTILLFLVFSLILYLTKISETVIPTFVVIVSALSILFGGVKATKDIESMVWLHGGLVGFFYMAILTILSLFIMPSLNFGWAIVLDLFLGFVVGVLAGILGTNL